MNGIIHGISWFPGCPQKFVTHGQEIKLYEAKRTNKPPSTAGTGYSHVHDDRESRNHSLQLSSKYDVSFLIAENRYQYVRCLKPSYHREAVVAVGLANGKIGICNFDPNNENNLEFTPRQQRTCLCLNWNENEKNILAIGHDRNRSDYCITIWDVERGLPKESTNFIGLSETCHSLCWDKNHRALIAGMSQKNIKVFDLRQSNTACTSITTRTVHGLSVAPAGNYLCSFLDSVICLWDLRCIEKPLMQIQTAKNQVTLEWCRTRSTLLSSLQRDSPYVHMIDVHAIELESGREVYHTKRAFVPFPPKSYANNKNYFLSDISWHPTDFEQALVLSETGSVIDFKIPPTIAMSWNTKNKLLRSFDLEMGVITPPGTPTTVSSGTPSPSTSSEATSAFTFNLNDAMSDDVAVVIRDRALNDYGLLTDIQKNGDLAHNPHLKTVWTILAHMNRDDRMLGLKNVLGIGTNIAVDVFATRSEAQVLQWPEFISSSNNLVLYRSEQRSLAQSLCGWTLDSDTDAPSSKFVMTLCTKKEFSRAAMICVFHLKILQACDILSKAADQTKDPSMFRIAAIALSSFNADRCSSTWRKQRSSANSQIQDAHLRAIFAFLSAENDNYELVLKEEGISLADRVAFACRYLNDTKLAEYVKQSIADSIDKGDLNGILLTGESGEGINILQSYVDKTEDVQTVSLIAIKFFHNEGFSEYRIQYWISSYLELLDAWGLWEKRAELEIKMENIKTAPRTARTVFLLCNFCGKSVSGALQEDVRIRNATSNVNKLSSCPNCRKPLPRCSLCLMHMGTVMSGSGSGGSGHDSLGWQSKPFSKWFSWCQTCRHGGHTEHLLQWFKKNSECPVAACSCRCFDLDASIAPKIIRDHY